MSSKRNNKSNGEASEPVNNFIRPWTIKNISQIIKASEGNFRGIVSEPFIVFKNVATMKLCWEASGSGSCILTPSVELRVEYPINVMVRMVVKCSQFAYELQDGLPWTVVPGKANVWDSHCTLDYNEFLIDDSITVTLEMIHLISTIEFERKKKQDDEQRIILVQDRYLKMFKNGEKTDFTIMVDDKEIKCHRFVISTTSSLLDCEDETLTESSIELKYYDYDCIYEFLLFLYSLDESCLSMDKYAKHFLALGDTYNVAYLKAAAESHLISTICQANARSFAWLGLSYNASRLRRKAEDMVSM